MPNDNALSFVGKIKTAYKAAQKAEGDALKHAIECGEQLNLAKENVEATNGKWKSWCNDNIPEIPQTTENLYRRLASAVANDANIFAKPMSIRDAIKMLPKRERKSSASETGADANSNVLLSRSPATPDLAATLQNAAVDEIYSALTQAWDREQIRDLITRLINYVTPPTDLNIPPALRRTGAPAQPSN